MDKFINIEVFEEKTLKLEFYTYPKIGSSKILML